MGMRPVRFARITQPFADPGSYASRADGHGPRGHHTGVDFGDRWAPSFRAIDNLPVRSSTEGLVVISERSSWAGEWVGVYYPADDVTITYWHMVEGSRTVSAGDWVKRGAVLGKVGTTGNSSGVHLHVQVNPGRGFSYHGHVSPARWCMGMGEWWPAVIEARMSARLERRKERRAKRRAERRAARTR